MPTSKDIIDPAHYRAARQHCRTLWPDLFFATHLLPAPRRHAVCTVAAVVAQLQHIVMSPDEGGCGVGCSGDEPMDQRRAVCAAVLDHLFSGEPTGKPELDGFAGVVHAHGLKREWFDPFAAGLAELQTTRRFATWKRVSGAVERVAAVALAAARILGAPVEELDTERWRRQVLAWGTGIVTTRLLLQIGRDWRRGLLRLPLDDLVRFNLPESVLSDVAALRADARWDQVIAFQTQRARNLLAGGSQWLALVPHQRPRRAALLFTLLHEALLDRLDADPAAALGEPIALTFWSRLRRIGATM